MCEHNSKVCKVCKEEKDFSYFHREPRGPSEKKSGYKSFCKDCASKKSQENWKNGGGRQSPEQKAKISENRKNKYHSDPEYREDYLARGRKTKSTEEYKKKARAQRKKWLESPQNKIADNLRSRMRSALDGRSKAKSTLEMTGIPFEDLKIYLESKFLPGMTWDNYGEWHIDHIIPCAYFDFTNPDHQIICFYYKNLQPLWAKENISKHAKVNIDEIQNLLSEIKTDLNIPYSV